MNNSKTKTYLALEFKENQGYRPIGYKKAISKPKQKQILIPPNISNSLGLAKDVKWKLAKLYVSQDIPPMSNYTWENWLDEQIKLGLIAHV